MLNGVPSLIFSLTRYTMKSHSYVQGINFSQAVIVVFFVIINISGKTFTLSIGTLTLLLVLFFLLQSLSN